MNNKNVSNIPLYNPIGQGFYTAEYLKSQSHKRTFPAHQIDTPEQPISTPTKLILPQGFGCYSRYFASRLPFAGTTDQSWIQNRAPLLPSDFSMLVWNGAHPDLQFAHFKANHIYDLSFIGLVPSHLAPRQTFHLQLPVETLFVQIYTTGNLSLCRDLILDTVWIDVEERRINCTYRKAFAEEIPIHQAELRYIARHQRAEQIELAKMMREQTIKDTNSYYIPLPPSLRHIPI